MRGQKGKHWTQGYVLPEFEEYPSYMVFNKTDVTTNWFSIHSEFWESQAAREAVGQLIGTEHEWRPNVSL